MSIASRITSIEEHIKESYQELEGIGIDTTEVNKNLENIPKLIDGYWETLPKVTGEGTSITLDNTKEGKMKINLKGNTYQETTTGKNLLPTSDIISTSGTISNGITFTLNSDGSIKANGTATGAISIYINADYTELSAGTYTFSDSVSSGESGTTYFLYADVEHTDGSSWDTYNFSTAETTTGMTQTIPEGFKLKTRIVVRNGQTLNNVVFKPMLEVGSSATSYESYTNGASPNPNYPQDIHVVSGDNSIDVCGKNMFANIVYKDNYIINSTGGEAYTPLGCIWEKIKVKPNTTYTLSYSSTDYSFAQRVSEYNSSEVFIQRNITNSSPYTFTTTSTTEYINLSGLKTDTNIQIELGSQATTYETYKGTSYPINLGNIELCKIVDYQDSIKKSTGKNLFDVSTIQVKKYVGKSTGNLGSSADWSATDYIEVKENTDYILSGIVNSYSDVAGTLFYNANKERISAINSNVYKFTTPSNAKYVRISLNSETPTNVMFNEGTVALPYEPYGKVWYVNKQIGKVAFSDLAFNEIGGNFSQFSTNGNIAMVYLQNDLKVTGNRDDVFCNLLKPYSSSLFGGLQTGINQYYNATKLLLSVPLANVENFAGETLTVNNYVEYAKNYIKNLNGNIYYVLATPTYTEITDSTLLSQLEAVNGSKSYTTQTNISQENNDNASILNVSALSE